MKPIEKLRRLPYHGTNGFGSCVTASKETIDQIADEIEAEISERYFPLPVDADGEIVHPGDTLYVLDGGYRIESAQLFLASNGHWSIASRRPDELTHANPRTRTIEEVLEDFLADYDRWDDYSTGSTRIDKRAELFKRYAKMIREVGGC